MPTGSTMLPALALNVAQVSTMTLVSSYRFETLVTDSSTSPDSEALQDVIAMVSYTAGPRNNRAKHLAYAALIYSKDEEDALRVVLVRKYELSDKLPPRGARGRQTLDEIESRLTALIYNESNECVVDLRYPNATFDQLWFPLPTVVDSDDRADTFFEIRGIRGSSVNRENGDIDYSFTLDRPLSRDVLLDLRFRIVTASVVDTPRTALKRAGVIARSLVGDQGKGAP